MGLERKSLAPEAIPYRMSRKSLEEVLQCLAERTGTMLSKDEKDPEAWILKPGTP